MQHKIGVYFWPIYASIDLISLAKPSKNKDLPYKNIEKTKVY